MNGNWWVKDRHFEMHHHSSEHEENGNFILIYDVHEVNSLYN